MTSIPQSEGLPVAELAEEAERYLEPLLRQLPEKRLRAVGVLMVLGILAGHSPIITQMARGVRDGSRYILDMARRMYRFVWNRRLSSCAVAAGLVCARASDRRPLCRAGTGGGDRSGEF